MHADTPGGLPVVVVDDHHHCLPDIHLAIRQRRLPFTGIHVLHVDAHPDLSFPSTLDASVVFDPETLYDSLDDSVAGIAEFLLPLVFAGHVNQITWLKPQWATQMPTGKFTRLAVGKRKVNDTLGVASSLPHFVEDELFCAVGDLHEASIRYWDLYATETSASTDETSWPATVTSAAMENVRQQTKAFVLDVDLDYFSTWNPFRRDLETRIGVLAVATVAQVFANVLYKKAALDAMTAEQRNTERIAFLRLLTRLQTATVSSFDPQHEEIVRELLPFYPEDVDAERMLSEFLVLLAQYQDDKATQREIWTAGPFLDLPHHESSLEEIERMVNELEQFLHANALDAANPPALVTIAKSTGDEFLPPHQLDIVLSSVLQMLERVFGELSMRIVEYEPIDDEGEAVKAATSSVVGRKPSQ